ncbi:MAG TPA: hypothetical protein VER11_34415 [Polyangiaceae bacterium]|nr:hypothetical protein [Polyangiaceae bacterium]
MTTYLRPLQRTDGRWDYTSGTGSSSPYPIGYCAGWRGPASGEARERLVRQFGEGFVKQMDADTEALRAHQAKYHTDGHATAAEAHECHCRYQLDNELELEARSKDSAPTLHRCAATGCGEFTASFAKMGQFKRFWLCDMHLTREAFEALLKGDSE